MPWTPTSAVAHAVYAAGFVYNPNADIIQSRLNPLQRHLGYCWGYDMAAPALSMIIDCEPFYFMYNDKLWMIELWKGQYGLETGAEIGLYRNDLGGAARDDHDLPFLPAVARSRFYTCVNDANCLMMRFKLFRKGSLLFERGPERHWWLTGFRWGVFTRKTVDLTMQAEITQFPSMEMRDSFAKSMEWKFYQPVKLGKDGVRFEFTIPRTPQPGSRIGLEGSVQKHNEELVHHYTVYKKWRHLSNNDPNNFTEVDQPVKSIKKAAAAAGAKIRAVPVGAKALDAVQAAAHKVVHKVDKVVPQDVVTAYHEIHNFFHQSKAWHVTARPTS